MIAIVIKGGMVEEIYTDDPDQVIVGVLVRDRDCEAIGEGGTDCYVPEYDPEAVREIDNLVCKAHAAPDTD